MSARFRNKVALVTGGTSGIGLRIAERLLEEDAAVCIAGTNVSKCDSLTDRWPGKVIILVTDVTDEPSVAGAIGHTVTAFGALDIVVNAAGVATTVTPLHEQLLDEFQRVMNVNATGAFIVLKHAARTMIALRTAGAVIINISSVNAAQPSIGMGVYCASKAAVAMVTKVAALELAPHGIRVVDVAPGLIETPMTAQSITSHPEIVGAIVKSTPLRRVGTTDDVASTVLFLASNEASFSTGSTTYVDGGILLQPPPARPMHRPGTESVS